MMTIPMDNSKENPTIERVQRLFNKNVELENKRRKAAQARVPSDPNIWQQMRENYEAIILEDHAFSEQHEVEYALWQLHYRRIEELRSLFNAAAASAGSAASQNGKSPIRSGSDRVTKIRSQFKTFLSEATGFYHDLMMKIKAKYGMPLGYFSDGPDNQTPLSKDGHKSSQVKKGLISCHRCLIYLGDLARYKGLYGEGESKSREFVAAASYYMQASSFWPSSGNPHHQLAILAGYSNDELVSIYCYFRSLAVENPFITARDNLIIAFEKNRQNYTLLVGNAKVSAIKTGPSRMSGKGRGKGETRSSAKKSMVENSSVRERASNNSELFKAFTTRFIRLNGILFTRTSLETFAEVFSVVKRDLLELLASGSTEDFNFGSEVAECRITIVRMVVVLIFTVHNVNKESENQSYADILQRSVLLQNAFTATFEFMGCILERCIQLNDPSSSYLLPGIMIFVEWLACCQDVAVGSELEEKQVNSRTYFWNKCISLLNKLLSSGYNFANDDGDESCFSNMSKYDESETANRLALPEDSELRGFLPLLPAQLILDFSRNYSFGGDGSNKENIARVQRIIAAGKSLMNIVHIGQEGVYFDAKLKKFVIGVEPETFDDYLLTAPLDSTLDGSSLVNPAGHQMSLDYVPIAAEVLEEDEEDEVIVFKPSINEKHIEELSSKLTSLDVRASVGDFKYEYGPFSGGQDSFLLQTALSSSMPPPITVADNTSHYPLSIQPSISKWSTSQAPILDGLPNLSFMENVSPIRSQMQDQFGVSQLAAVSLPYPQFITGHNFSTQIPQAALLSNFDSVLSSGLVNNAPHTKPFPVVQPGLKKNPVSRPVRHIGPPPGFASVRPEVVDESPNNMALKNETHPIPCIDDYSWLDGEYQLSSLHHSVGFSSSNHQVGPAFHAVSNNNGSTGIAGFPFPGKQGPTLQVHNENRKGWQEYQFQEHTKLNEDQLGQFQNGNQQSVVGNPHQYQGQSLWEGRFFV